MNILVCGAHGFLGRHISQALLEAGHTVIHGVRQAGKQSTLTVTEIAMDFACDTSTAIWEARFRQMPHVDVLINAVGILSESAGGRYHQLHRDTPIAMFQAAANCGIKTVVQISALGGRNEGENATKLPAFLQSKRAADTMLMQSGLTYLILRPSLVVGLDGASSQLFRTLASLPCLGLPGAGEQQLQPVHVDDICTAIVHWLADQGRQSQVLCAVGARPLSYKRMLEIYRAAMGMPPQYSFAIPMPAMRLAARMAQYLPQSSLTPDSLHMLEQDNVADPQAFKAQLKKPAIPPENWFNNIPAHLLASAAIASWSLPLFRYVLAMIWFVTAALSFGIYPISASLQLLQPLGLSGMPAMLTLMAASGLDLCLGFATLLKPGRRLWLAQLALVSGYSMVIAIFSPEYYLHPFGPILKNLAVLALLLHLYSHQRNEK